MLAFLTDKPLLNPENSLALNLNQWQKFMEVYSVILYISADAVSKDRKKRKPKSMFPVTSKMENRGKQFLLDDLVTLAKLVFGKRFRSVPS